MCIVLTLPLYQIYQRISTLSDCVVAVTRQKEELKYSIMDSGVLFVITSGTFMMPQLCATALATLELPLLLQGFVYAVLYGLCIYFLRSLLTPSNISF